MKEKIGVILASAMLVAGCDSMQAHGLDFANTPPKIDANAVASELPGAVAEQIPNAIAYRRMILARRGFDEMNLLGICSGIRVGDNEYLSAGHCGDDIAAEKKQAVEECENGTVEIANGSSGASLPITATADTYIPSINQYDSMLIHTAGGDPTYSATIHFRESAVSPGEPLYVVNFEPTAGGQFRTPYDGSLNPETAQEGYDRPVVLGAVALGAMSNGQIIALEGLKSYDQSGETTIREGASGGAIFDKDGNLVGLVAGVLTDPYTIQSLGAKDHVEITGLPQDAPANAMSFQPVTPHTVADLETKLQPVPPTC